MSGLGRTLLIAGREFKAYVATASFWVALAVGPIVLIAMVLLASLSSRPGPVTVRLVAGDAQLAVMARDALSEAGAAAHRPFQLVTGGGPAAITLRLHRGPGGVVLSAEGAAVPAEDQALIRLAIERDLALGGKPMAPAVSWLPRPAADTALAADRVARFGLVIMLWMTLAGSLGMLLQAVVRERANHALETLLAAVSPLELVSGKLLGVGGVSFLVLGAWLLSAGGLEGVMPQGSGVTAAVLHAAMRPGLLVTAIAAYLAGFAIFGFVTIAVGASACDSAAAQNQARPMFAMLLAVFFAAFASAGGAGAVLDWLIYVPPFAPFMLLLHGHSLPQVSLAMGLSIIFVMLACGLAVRRLQPGVAQFRLGRPRFSLRL